MTEEVEESWWTAPQAAREIGVSDQTVDRWLNLGKVPYTRNELGHRVIRRADIPDDLIQRTLRRSQQRWPGGVAALRSQSPSPEPGCEELLREMRDERDWLREHVRALTEMLRAASS